ncbi:hypothetical protein [Lachnobacterium bovis]|uniref:hypothetical protein n=1 Tax=Lachnobacterium bovis TaxID=140626 RepID=UPI000487D805|nr:hypothetical protein [Lachnobacterium bovis]
MDRNEEMRKSKKKKKGIKRICIIMAVVIAVVFCVPFDFKYIKKKSKQGGIDFSTFEFVERSTTPDDSVCVVSDIDKEGKKYFDDNKDYLYDSFNNCFTPQRLSSNKFASFKIDISQRTFDLFTLLKTHFTGYKFKLNKREELRRNADDNPYVPGYDVSRIDSVKTQYYDIDKKRSFIGKDIFKIIRKTCIKKNTCIIQPYKIRYSKNYKTGKWDIMYGYADICDKYDNRCGILLSTGNGYINDDRYKWREFEVEDVYKVNYLYDNDSDCMDDGSFYELLKKNGMGDKDIYYIAGKNNSYDDVEMYVRTESLPKESAKMYKIYPKLKQFIGKKNKLVSFFIKGIQNPDEIVSYFLPDGKKVNYGKEGIKYVNSDKERFRSYKEYLQIIKKEKSK